jgi:hypothetical protein
MRFIEEQCAIGPSLHRPLIVDPFFDGSGLIDDIVQTTTCVQPSSLTTSYPVQLTQQPNSPNLPLQQPRHHQQQPSVRQQQSLSATNCRPTGCGSSLQHQQQQQLSRRTADDCGGGGGGGFRKKAAESEGRATATVQPQQQTAARLQTATDAVIHGSIDTHLASPEWVNLVTSINLQPLVVDEEANAAARCVPR